MIELDDCGKKLRLSTDFPWRDSMDVTVIMVIKAPRGTMALFENKPILEGYYDSEHKGQRIAIRSFMEEHKND